MSNDTVLVLVVITALCFDFTNGFHDTGNAMATSSNNKPSDADINRVRSHLAAGGWPLAVPPRD